MQNSVGGIRCFHHVICMGTLRFTVTVEKQKNEKKMARTQPWTVESWLICVYGWLWNMHFQCTCFMCTSCLHTRRSFWSCKCALLSSSEWTRCKTKSRSKSLGLHFTHQLSLSKLSCRRTSLLLLNSALVFLICNVTAIDTFSSHKTNCREWTLPKVN